MLFEMTVFAVHWHKILGIDKRQHSLQLVLTRVPRHVQLFQRAVQHLCASAVQIVDKRIYRLFVAGYGLRRYRNHVAVGDDDRFVFAVCHSRQRAHRLALRPRGYNAKPVRLNTLDILDIYDGVVTVFQHTQLSRYLGYLDHAPAVEGYLSAHLFAYAYYLLNSVDVACKRGDYDPVVRMGIYHSLQRHTYFLFGYSRTALFDVGRLSEHQRDPFVADSRDTVEIYAVAVDGRIVYLIVARMEYHSVGICDRQCKSP